MSRNALITGANGGIGLACVKKFLSEGYGIFAHFHKSACNLDDLHGCNIRMVQGNFAWQGDVRKVSNEVMAYGEPVDVLVNCAGMISVADAIEDITGEDFDRMMSVNLKAPFLLTQWFFREMRKAGYGRIVNISSIGVKYGGNPSSVHYTMSKAALEIMTKGFAKVGAPHNVLVNAIRPGVTDTALVYLNHRKNMTDRMEMVPIKRIAQPEEIAEVVYFLGSEKNTYATGSIVDVSGGD